MGLTIAAPFPLGNMGGRRGRDKEFGTSCGSRAPIAGLVVGVGELPGGKVVLPVGNHPRRGEYGSTTR